MLPLRIARALLKDRSERRAFLVQASLRILLTFGLTLFLGWAQAQLITAILKQYSSLSLERLEGIGPALASLYGTLCMVEWCIIALTRDYDDQISRRASLVMGLIPEDPEARPRIRLDIKWLKKKIQRRIRGYRVYLIALPAAAPLLLIPLVGNGLYSTLLTLWTLYWSVVFTAAKSGAAWKDEDNAPDPWFIMGFQKLTDRTGGFGIMRAYGRWWKKHSRDMFAPCRSVAYHPSSMTGLAIFRAFCDLPGLYFLARPFLPVAAAHILQKAPEREAAMLNPSPAPEIFVPQEAPSPLEAELKPGDIKPPNPPER